MVTVLDNIAPGKVIVVFDGECKLCNAWVNFIIRYDKNNYFKLASAQSPPGIALLERFHYPTDHYQSLLVINGSQCLDKSDAALFVLQRLGLPWSIACISRILPRRLRDVLYDKIAANRYRWFGRYAYCVLPAPEHKHRFLE